MKVFLVIVFVTALTVGLAAIPFGLPGTFIILAAAFLYAWATHFAAITWTTLIILLAAALLAEVIEALAGLAGAKRYGSGGAGMAASLIGGFIGALIGAPLLFGLGAIPGALIGAFAAAFLAEILRGRRMREALHSGWGTLLGRLAGTMTKMTVGVGMVVFCLVRIFS